MGTLHYTALEVQDRLDRVGELETQISSPYNFKGSVATVGDLPANGNTVNDTYYVTGAKCRYTWTGSAWAQSSMDEADYTDELAEVKNELGQETGAAKVALTSGYVTCNASPVNLTPYASSSWQCAVLSCTEGDVFTLTGLGGNGARLWCFINASNTVIENAYANANKTDLVLTAPQGATHLVFNDNSLSGNLYAGKTDVADKLQTDVNRDELKLYNSINALDYAELVTQPVNGVTYTPTANGIFASGKATSASLYRISGYQTTHTLNLIPGKTYRVKYSAQNVNLEIRRGATTLVRTTTDTLFTVPSDVSGNMLQVLLVVSNGTTVSETVKPAIFNALTNAELEELATENLVSRMRHDDASENDITWEWTDNNSRITVSGTATDASVLPLIANTDVPPEDISSDNEYFIDFSDEDVHVALRAYDSDGNQILYADFNTPSFAGLPHGTARVAFSLVVSSGTTVNKTLVAPAVYHKMRLTDLSKIVGQISHKVGYADQIPSDDECVNAFVAELNAMAASWGMEDTVITSPSGLDDDSAMSVKDILKVAVMGLSDPDLLDITSTSDFSMPIYGQHARTITVSNSYLSAIKSKFLVHDDYALGGKGGSLVSESDAVRTQVTYADIDGHLTALCLMGKGMTSYTNLYNTCDDVALAIKAVYAGATPTVTANMTELVESGGGYIAVECPQVGVLYTKQMPSAKILERFASVSDGTASVNRPASVIKIMSTMLALRYIVDKSAFISLHLSDITGGSGSAYFVGDKINVIDMLKAMLVESSNTLATAMARYIGAHILSGRR